MSPFITTASVKVMRSHDYCHFEVNLSTDLQHIPGEHHLEAVDNLRKEAARLVDKAVEQYKVSKRAREIKGRFEVAAACEAKQAEETPEAERSSREKAILKYNSDAAFRSRFQYDYQDDYQEVTDDDID